MSYGEYSTKHSLGKETLEVFQSWWCCGSSGFEPENGSKVGGRNRNHLTHFKIHGDGQHSCASQLASHHLLVRTGIASYLGVVQLESHLLNAQAPHRQIQQCQTQASAAKNHEIGFNEEDLEWHALCPLHHSLQDFKHHLYPFYRWVQQEAVR